MVVHRDERWRRQVQSPVPDGGGGPIGANTNYTTASCHLLSAASTTTIPHPSLTRDRTPRSPPLARLSPAPGSLVEGGPRLHGQAGRDWTHREPCVVGEKGCDLVLVVPWPDGTLWERLSMPFPLALSVARAYPLPSAHRILPTRPRRGGQESHQPPMTGEVMIIWPLAVGCW
jgi:hypothetical protein